jgi:hypothetical protein
MRLRRDLTVNIIDPEEKTAMKRNETKRNRFLEKPFIVPAGTPFIPKCIAFFVQASTHLPHLLQKTEALPLFTSSGVRANNGQTSTHL